MLRDIEEEEVDDSFVRVRHKQELLKETTRTIATKISRRFWQFT